MNESGTLQSNKLSIDARTVGILAKTGSAVTGAVVQRTRVAPALVNPIIAPASPMIVVVKKPHTRPARVKITLKTSTRTRRPGTLTRIKTATSGNIRLFDAATNGNEITFTPIAGSTTHAEHAFTANELNAEVNLFAESETPHANLNDFRLRLSLAPGPTSGPQVEVTLTAVELTLDICLPRTAPAPLPNPLPQPPATRPAAARPGSDKWFGGGVLFAQDLPGKHNQRAQLIMQQVKPAAFSADLILRQVAVSGDNVTFPDNRLQLFDRETASPGESPKNNPHIFGSVSSPLGFALFVEGRTLTGFRGAGFQLGIRGKELDGDRIAITVLRNVLTNNVAPFSTVISRTQIEGILNTDRASFDVGDLFGTQRNSLFRARVDAPGLNPTTQTISASLVSNSRTGTIDAIDPLTLTRTSPTSDTFLSRPILAMPMAIKREQVTLKSPQDIEVIMTQAGGKLSLQVKVATLLGLLGIAEATVRGRVVNIFAQGFTGSGATTPFIQNLIDRANIVWAQAGIEVKARSVDAAVTPPAGLLDLDTLLARNNFNGTLTAEERRLLRIDPNGPTRSTNANDMNIYFVRVLVDPVPTNAVPFGAIAYVREAFPAIVEPGHSAIALEGTGLTGPFLAHELGHHLLRGWVGDEHKDTATPQQDWPITNVMHDVIFENSDIVDKPRYKTS